LDVAFVDQDGVVSQLSLKKDSALNLFEFLLSLKNLDGAEVAIASTCCTLSGEAWEYGQSDEAVPDQYFIAQVSDAEFVPEPVFRAVVEFAQSGLFCWVTVGESEGG
jgi:hypothetical protein